MSRYDKVVAEMQALEEERTMLKERLRELEAERSGLAASEAARARVEAMSDGEREALRQALSLTGVASAEEFGVPGA